MSLFIYPFSDDPGPFYKLQFRLTGTTTPASVYSDEDLTTPHTNPVIADANGNFPEIFTDPDVDYRVNLLTATDAQVSGCEADPYAGSPADAVVRADFADFVAGLNYSAISTAATGAANTTTLAAEIAALSAAGGGILTIKPSATAYQIAGDIALKSNVTIRGYGVSFEGSARFYAATAVTNIGFEGFKYTRTDGVATMCFQFNGANPVRIKDVEFAKLPVTGGYIGVGYDTHNVEIDGFKFSGANGILINGDNWRVNNWHAVAAGSGDDCWTIKTNGPRSARNIVIGPGICDGFTAPLSPGSEVGAFAADDPTFAYRIADVTMTGVVARNCSHLVFIKPGANTGNDYRDGTVENITISNCVLDCRDGTHFNAGVMIWAGRGGLVRNIKINDCTVIARALNGTTVTNYGVWVRALDFWAAGSRPSEVSNIEINNFKVVDPYGGNDIGVGGAPGYPIDYGILFEITTGGPGTQGVIGRFNLANCVFDGTRRGGISVGANIAGPITVESTRVSNYSNVGDAAADASSVIARSNITLRNYTAIPSPAAAAYVRGIISDGNAATTTGDVIGEREVVRVPSIAAGTALDFILHSFPRKSWIKKVSLVTPTAVTASDANYATLALVNTTTGGTLKSVTTKTTGGLAIPANTPTSLNGTTIFSGADSEVDKDGLLKLTVAHTGTGAAIVNPILIIEYVPFGAA